MGMGWNRNKGGDSNKEVIGHGVVIGMRDVRTMREVVGVVMLL